MPEIMVRINSNKVTDNDPVIENIVEDSLVIESYIGQVVDTCELTIFDKYSDMVIQSMSEIIITRADINNGDVDAPFPNPGEQGNRLFSGLVVYIVGEPVGFSTYWTLTCQDFTIMLDRTLTLGSYPANFEDSGHRGDIAILYNVFNSESYTGGRDLGSSAGASEILITNDTIRDGLIQQGLNALELQSFRFSTLREVVSTLAQYVGFDFYVDYYKRLHYYYREEELAPYALTDGRLPTGIDRDGIHFISVDVPIRRTLPALTYRSCSWKRDGSRLVNAFALFGDRLLSDPITLAMSYTEEI